MLRKLQCFFAVVEVGSFTGAAQALYVSQSAVSQQVSQLEREVKAKLIVRDTHGMRLTPSGRYLYDNMRPLVVGMEDVLARVASACEDATFVVRHHGPTDDFLTIPILGRLRSGCGSRVRLERIGRSGRSLEDVVLGRVDLALGKEGEGLSDPALAFRPACETHLTCLLPPGHRLARRDVIDVEDVLDEPVVLLENRDALSVTGAPRGRLRYQEVHDAVRAGHHDPDLVSVASDAASAVTMMRAGLGITFVDSLKVTDAGGIACVPLRAGDLGAYGAYYRLGCESPELAVSLEAVGGGFDEPPVLMPGGRLVPKADFLARHPGIG